MRHGLVLHFYGAGRFSHGMKELLFAMHILHHKNKICSPHHCKASRCSHSWKGSFQDATFCHSFTHIPAGVGIGWAHPRKKFTFVSLYALCFKCTLRNTMHCSTLSKESPLSEFWLTHQGHVNAMSIFPDMIETFHYADLQILRDAVETNELLDSCLLMVIAGLRCVHSIDQYGYITENTRIH